MPLATDACRDRPDVSDAEAALLGPKGVQTSKEGDAGMSVLPSRSGQARSTQVDRPTKRSGGPGARLLARQDGLRRTIVRLNGKEDYVTKIRVPDHVHGHSRRAPGVAPPDDHGQSIASTSSIYGKERHPNRQLLLIQKRRLRTPPVAVSGGCEQSSKGTRKAPHHVEVHPRKSPVDGRLLGAPGLLSQGVIKSGPWSGIAGRRRTQDASL
ncbi:hypothetical protein T10_7213 [Trichinella papuae]|uniref:Uncharacterized protein n=1 Tax=Trichinella papuae TaxID=268474 RepID=A0A0V1MIA3_9BILA|nr:hypothetical protein T10_7213 [Trichinella papuae]